MTDENNSTVPIAEPLESDPTQAGRSRNLSREAARWRVQFRGAQSRIAELENQLASLRGAGTANQQSQHPGAETSPLSATGSEAGAAVISSAAFAEDVGADPLPADASELLALRDELRGAVLQRELEAHCTMADVVGDLLAARGLLTFDDASQPALIIDGLPVAITHESLSRVLDSRLMRSTGATGTGSHGGRAAVAGFDFQRGLTDSRYFRANAAAMRAEMAKRGGK